MSPRILKLFVHLKIITLFIAPIIFISTGIVEIQYRFYILGLLLLFFLVDIRKQKLTSVDLGLKSYYTVRSVVDHAIFTGVALFFMVAVFKAEGFDPIQEWWRRSHFIYNFILLSFLQEVLYRGYLVHELRRIYNSRYLIIGINAALFSFLHVIYDDSFLGLIMTLVGGVGWTWLYIKYKNIALLTISHAVLNFAIVYYGVFLV